jgi:hypothetical protein
MTASALAAYAGWGTLGAFLQEWAVRGLTFYIGTFRLMTIVAQKEETK